MATRSTIGRITEQGIESIYCHWDGYPDGVGATLREHYTSESKIEKLFNLGDLSALAEDIGKKQDFEKRTEGWCLAYGRDRGETETESKFHDTVAEWIEYRDSNGCEYGYFWNGSEWTVHSIG
jgi:hypothetical protein